jgi:hypothetical protein
MYVDYGIVLVLQEKFSAPTHFKQLKFTANVKNPCAISMNTGAIPLIVIGLILSVIFLFAGSLMGSGMGILMIFLGTALLISKN